MILPTGKRIKRNVTFGPCTGLDGGSRDEEASEDSPLLGDQSGKNHRRSRWRRLSAKPKQWATQAWNFANSGKGRGVFKCSIAYLLGSLATFIPEIAALLGTQDGKHMVATITVYFHPARSIGSMFEAMLCAAVAFIYAAFISFSSMGVSIFFGDTLDQIVLGHAIVLIVFCGGGLGFVGWIKQRLGHPLVNISCSLTSLAIITVLTKEGAIQAALFSDDKVNQVMFMILMGVLATTAVSFLIWPVSARKDLKEDLVSVTDTFAELLTIITQAFLSGSEGDIHKEPFQEATKTNKKLYTSLTKNLEEAKYEHYLLGTEREHDLEVKLVNCMQQLGQNIGGLRSAATTQFLLLAHSHGAGKDIDTGVGTRMSENLDKNASRRHTDSYFPQFTAQSSSPTQSYSILASVDRTLADRSITSTPFMVETPKPQHSESHSSISTADDMFSTFIVQLGPSMVSEFRAAIS